MNLSALPELLLAWVKTQGTALLQGQKGDQAAGFKPGEVYTGKVMDVLASGRYLVQVGGQKLDMGLPQGTRTGDSVRLTYLHTGPRPTFLLNPTQAPSTQPVQLSGTAQQVGALMRLAPATPHTLLPPQAAGAAAPAGAVAASPGQAAVQATVQAAAQTAAAPGPAGQGMAPGAAVAPGPSATPPGPAVRVAQAAQALHSSAAAPASGGPAQAPASGAGVQPIIANVVVLKNHVQFSGSITGMVAAPNAGPLGQAVDGLRAALATGTSLQTVVVSGADTDPREVLPARLAQTLKESGLFYEAHLARWTRGTYPFESILNEPQARLGRGAAPLASLAELGGMPEEAARLAGRQLHMLEGQPLLWQGYAWPGQWMDWLVHERGGGQGGEADAEPATAWTTELRLSLPRLGALNARLDLRARSLDLELWAAEPRVAESLRQALPDLAHSLALAGLEPGRLSVSTGQVDAAETQSAA